MKMQTTLATLALLALISGPAMAFEQQNGGTAAPATKAQQAPAATAQTPQTGFAAPSQGNADTQGTEITLPGLGTLGVLPKMDFGLELLYGAEPNQPVEDLQEQEAESDDLRIRGTIKHQF